MNFFIAALAILLITIVGYIIIRGFALIEDKFLSIGVGFGLGVGLVYLQLFLYSRIGIPWDRNLVIYPWIILGIVILAWKKKKFRFKIKKYPKFSWFVWFLALGILIACAYVLLEAIIRPPVAWDAWATWLLKSKIFFLNGNVSSSALSYATSDYPLVINLLGTFIYVVLGHIDDTAVLLTSVAFFVFLALTFFAFIKSRFGLQYALFYTFLLVTTQILIRQGGRLEAGLADLPLGYFTFVSIVLLFEYFKTNKGRLFLILNIFLGFLCLIKFEGLPIAFFIEFCGFYHLYKKRLYQHAYSILLFLLPVIDWYSYLIFNPIHTHYFSVHTVEISVSKTIGAIYGTLFASLNIKSWNLLFVVYMQSFFNGFKKSGEQKILNLLIISQIVIYLVLYIFTAGNAPNSSIDRLLVHLAPLVILSIALFGYMPNFKPLVIFIRKQIN